MPRPRAAAAAAAASSSATTIRVRRHKVSRGGKRLSLCFMHFACIFARHGTRSPAHPQNVSCLPPATPPPTEHAQGQAPRCVSTVRLEGGGIQPVPPRRARSRARGPCGPGRPGLGARAERRGATNQATPWVGRHRGPGPSARREKSAVPPAVPAPSVAVAALRRVPTRIKTGETGGEHGRPPHGRHPAAESSHTALAAKATCRAARAAFGRHRRAHAASRRAHRRRLPSQPGSPDSSSRPCAASRRASACASSVGR